MPRGPHPVASGVGEAPLGVGMPVYHQVYARGEGQQAGAGVPGCSGGVREHERGRLLDGERSPALGSPVEHFIIHRLDVRPVLG